MTIELVFVRFECKTRSTTQVYKCFKLKLFMAALCNRAGHYICALWFLIPPPYPLWNRAGHYIFILCFLLSSSSVFFLLFSLPNLSRRRLDVYHTSTHGVALVRILGCRSETCCTRLAEIQDAKIAQKSPSRHHRTTLSGCIFATKDSFFFFPIDNRKKLVK